MKHLALVLLLPFYISCDNSSSNNSGFIFAQKGNFTVTETFEKNSQPEGFYAIAKECDSYMDLDPRIKNGLTITGRYSSQNNLKTYESGNFLTEFTKC